MGVLPISRRTVSCPASLDGAQQPKRRHGHHSRSLRLSRSRPPSLDTVYEARDTTIDPCPLQSEALGGGASSSELMGGPLLMRPPTWPPLRLLFRRHWLVRHAVLQAPGVGGGCPHLLLFEDASMDVLLEDVSLLAPLQLECLPAEGGHMRFTLSAARGAPVELAATSEEEQVRWMVALGDAVCPSSPVPSSPAAPSPSSVMHPDGPACHALERELPVAGGRVRLRRSKVSDHYTFQKMLSQDGDILVVEGLQRDTWSSYALKLVGRGSTAPSAGPPLAPAQVCALVDECLEAVYEGPNHVCLVMHWGTHERDAGHQLAAAVLEALRLLHELLPRRPANDEQHSIMLTAGDLRNLIERAAALDRLLQTHILF